MRHVVASSATRRHAKTGGGGGGTMAGEAGSWPLKGFRTSTWPSGSSKRGTGGLKKERWELWLSRRPSVTEKCCNEIVNASNRQT